MRVVCWLVFLVFLVGCSPQAPGPLPPSPSTAGPSPTLSPSLVPSPSPSPTVVESFQDLPASSDAEVATVLDGWMAYERAVDVHKRDPSQTDYRALEITTTDTETSRVIGAIAALRDKGWQRSGDTVSRFMSIDGPVTDENGIREAMITYCVNPGHSSTTDTATGEVVVKQTDTLLAQVRMRLMPDGSWRASWYGAEFRPC